MTKDTKEIVYGMHAVGHALESSPGEVFNLWIQQGKKSSPELDKIKGLASQLSISTQFVSKEKLTEHTGTGSHQGVAIMRKSRKPDNVIQLDELLSYGVNSSLLILVLDGIQDPHNLGACLRTADAAGVDAVIIPKDRAVSVNATVRKVASGGAESVPIIIETNIARTLKELQQQGVWVVGTAGDVDKTIFELDLRMPLAIVMGSEGRGLRKNTRDHCDQVVSLPMSGVVESLNVSVATGICLYEVLRQRGIG